MIEWGLIVNQEQDIAKNFHRQEILLENESNSFLFNVYSYWKKF